MDVDTISPTGGEEKGEGMLDDTRRDLESEEDDDMSGEAPAPSELARSLGCHRTTLQQVRRKLHGQGNTQGIYNGQERSTTRVDGATSDTQGS